MYLKIISFKKQNLTIKYSSDTYRGISVQDTYRMRYIMHFEVSVLHRNPLRFNTKGNDPTVVTPN